jgi:hypothetical protein
VKPWLDCCGRPIAAAHGAALTAHAHPEGGLTVEIRSLAMS